MAIADFASRTLRGIDEEVGDAVYSVLDGQQRLTALYRAYFDTDPKRVFFFRIGEFVREGAVTDDSFAHVARGTWNRICPEPESQADPVNGEQPRVLGLDSLLVTFMPRAR